MIPEIKYPLYARTLTKVAIIYTIQKINNHPTTQENCPICNEPTTGAKSLSKHLLHAHGNDELYKKASKVHEMVLSKPQLMLDDKPVVKWQSEQEFMDFIKKCHIGM
jgi:hypothetical protein